MSTLIVTGKAGAVVLLLAVVTFFAWGCSSMGRYRETLSYGGAEVPKAEVSREIRSALSRADERPEVERLEIYREASRSIVTLVGAESDAGFLLEEALRDDSAEGARAGLESALDALEFQSMIEADLPEGFPEPSVVGLVRVKSYPVTRKAEVSSEDGRNAGFMDLFRHIKANEIAMTAPVDMSMKSSDRMAFYYGSREIGETGSSGVVEVVDSAPLTVVSVAVRGAYSQANFEETVAKLREWLEENGREWTEAGEPRILAYNSPFIPWFWKLSEVQIPIRPAE